MVNKLSSAEVYAVILITQVEHKQLGTLFSAINDTQKKKGRKWSCRLGVTKHLKGGKPAYNAEDRNFITVWDPNATVRFEGDSKYRQLNVSTLSYLRVSKEVLIENGVPTEAYLRRRKTAKVMNVIRKGKYL